MNTGQEENEQSFTPHTGSASPWVRRFANHLASGGRVLDVACGNGRHTRLLAEAGHAVTAVDRDIAGLAELSDLSAVTAIEADLETGAPFPLAGTTYDAVVVTNYLWRPLMPDLIAAVADGGLLIYETFARGNEKFGRPRNPDHLLKPGELLEAVRGTGLEVMAYEHGEIAKPQPAVIQRICARRV